MSESVDWTWYIDIYCERTDPSLLAEPLNFFFNFAFIFAGWLCLRSVRTVSDDRQAVVRYMSWLVITIGIGSGLFHSFATLWAQVADVVFIGIFLLVFMGVWGWFIAGYRLPGLFAIFTLFVMWTALFAIVLDRMTWNGLNIYFGMWFMLLMLAGDSWYKKLGME